MKTLVVVLIVAAIVVDAYRIEEAYQDAMNKKLEREEYRHQMAPELERRGCKAIYAKCTKNSDCCDKTDWAGRKLRCLNQCTEGGCLDYNQCLFYGGIQKK